MSCFTQCMIGSRVIWQGMETRDPGVPEQCQLRNSFDYQLDSDTKTPRCAKGDA